MSPYAPLCSTTAKSPHRLSPSPFGQPADRAACTASDDRSPSRAARRGPGCRSTPDSSCAALVRSYGRRQVMVSPPSVHEEHLAAGTPMDHAANIQRLTHRPDSDRARGTVACQGATCSQSSTSFTSSAAIGRSFERLLTGDLRNAETAADVERAQGLRREFERDGCRANDGLALRFDDRMRPADSASPREDVETPESRAAAERIRCSTAGSLVGVDAELFRAAALFMPEVLSSKSGFTRTATFGRRASDSASRAKSSLRAPTRRSPRHGRGSPLQFARGLVRTGEADQFSIYAGSTRPPFRPRIHIQTVDHPRMCWTTSGIGFALMA